MSRPGAGLVCPRMPPQVAPYGSWSSPIAAADVAGAVVRLLGVAAEAERSYWLEARPTEGGRSVLVEHGPDGDRRDVTPAGFDVRTRVHEYGGGAFLLDQGQVYFSNDGDGRVYRQALGGEPEAISPAPPSPRALRYGDFCLDRARGRLLAVREDHTAGGEPVNTVVSLPLDGQGEPTVLLEGRDFYAAPRLSPDGERLCFVAWDHPDLPFVAAMLFEARLDAAGRPGPPALVAGAEHGEPGRASIAQPLYSPEGVLTFVSDVSGFYNLHQHRDGQTVHLAPVEAALSPPPWALGRSTYAFTSERELLVARGDRGRWSLQRLDLDRGRYEAVALPFTSFGELALAGEEVVAIVGGPRQPPSVIRVGVGPEASPHRVLRQSFALDVDEALFSAPEPITFPTEGGAVAHAFYYPPHNPDFVAPEGERPPLIVKAHGGPTSNTTTTLDPRIQFWTSRGFGLVDVDYRGSTGYGRAYRDALEHRWGIVDVDDCAAAAKHLVEAGRVDADRLVITGGSAGGYTTLASLAFRDVYRAGASHYGVSDLEALMADTHKFESRYDVYLLGADESGQRADVAVMRERSPIHAADRLDCPVIFIQGLEDRVVPPNQAERMVAALDHKGIGVAYVAFEGEQHGFRRAENIARALEAELYFYAAVLGFPLADDIEPIPIRNLPESALPRRRTG